MPEQVPHEQRVTGRGEGERRERSPHAVQRRRDAELMQVVTGVDGEPVRRVRLAVVEGDDPAPALAQEFVDNGWEQRYRAVLAALAVDERGRRRGEVEILALQPADLAAAQPRERRENVRGAQRPRSAREDDGQVLDSRRVGFTAAD